METKRDPIEIEALLRRVRPAAPSDALRQRVLARARDAWHETPAAAGTWCLLLLPYAAWSAAAAVLLLGLFINGLLAPSGVRGSGVAPAPPPVVWDGLDDLRGVLGDRLFAPQPAAGPAVGDCLRERQAQLRELLRDASLGAPAPPGAAPQSESNRGDVDKTVGATRLMG